MSKSVIQTRMVNDSLLQDFYRGVKYKNQNNNNDNNFGLTHKKFVNNSLNNNQISVPSTKRNVSNSRCDTNDSSIGNGSDSNFINNNYASSENNMINSTIDNSEEILDLGDLDLSQLRLSKKDLQALSSITPALSQRVQQQLLAQLPPQQAKKLSRTLSMQNGNITPNTNISYRRSISSSTSRTKDYDINHMCESRDSITPTNDTVDDTLCVQNRDLSKTDRSTRNSINAKDAPLVSSYNEDLGKSSTRFPYLNVSHERFNSYEKYTPYSTNYHNTLENERSRSVEVDRRFNNYDSLTSRSSCLSPTNEYCRRPPSGYISPPPASSSGYSNQKPIRRVSRFLRPDFFNPPKENYEQNTLRKELETQQVLREIREKSREKSIDRCFSSDHGNDGPDRLSYFISKYGNLNTDNNNLIDKDHEKDLSKHSLSTRSRRSTSITREEYDRNSSALNANNSFANIVDDLLKVSINQESADDSKTLQHSNDETTTIVPISEAICKMPSVPNANGTCSECNQISVNPVDEFVDNNNAQGKQTTEPATVVKTVKVKKLKTKSKLESEGNSGTATVRKIKKVVKPVNPSLEELNNASNNVCDNTMPSKKESKLTRPKSYPSKEPATSMSTATIDTAVSNKNSSEKKEEILDSKLVHINTATTSKIARPKSFPSSKLTPPKEIQIPKNTLDNLTLSAISEKIENKSQVDTDKSAEVTASIPADSPTVTPVVTKKVRKVIRIVKKPVASKNNNTQKVDSTSGGSAEVKETNGKSVEIILPTAKEKSKSPEKKVKQGFLATIGQKFEKFRDSNKIMKDKKSNPEINETALDENLKKDDNCNIVAKNENKKCHSDGNVLTLAEDGPVTESNRKSRIDKVIKNLRDMSVPRPPVITESNLIKRAVSVEEMPGTFNKRGVSKVLGFFKKIEKESKNNKVLNTKSSSHINTLDATSMILEPTSTKCTIESTVGEDVVKQRPKSGSFVSKIHKPYSGTRSDTVLTLTEQPSKSNIKPNGGIKNLKQTGQNKCLDCYKVDSVKKIPSRHSLATDTKHLLQDEKARVKCKCQSLALNIKQLNDTSHAINANNNYSYPPPLPNEMSHSNLVTIGGTSTVNNNTLNTNMLTPSYDSITNYSSGSRSSPFDDCNSSSTFMSPSEENELCSDNWSISSDDHNSVFTTSNSASRMSRLTYMNSVSPVDNDSESVIERIRRKSFYSRFNDKRLKTVSAATGTGTLKEHYRDQYLSNCGQPCSRSKEYGKSSALASTDREKNNYDYYRSLSRTPSVSMRNYSNSSNGYSKPSTSNSDYYHHHHHHYHYHLPKSNSSRKLNVSSHDCADKLNYTNTSKSFLRNTYHETLSPTYYATYQPRRCSLYTNNSTTANITSSSSSIALDTTNINKECTAGAAITSSSSTTLSGSEGFATLNKGLRKTRAYDNRSISLLNSSAIRESSFDTTGTPRSGQLGKSSIPRHPTNV
ncbi:probable serine/threonine-protein kinase DDB_G0282963 [Sabethes cyaneus]|uniref:probable serine/threonine-protein kinase DDB_G0282963 n=1 Tax=Sabethes cyaneus TaxID=53552 RepID=UPI00237DB53A|nr:probable serine/threonine-protein kinase DDB_G0282963 [Sabethes cyaneus]